MYIYIYTYIHMYVRVCVYIYIYICIYTSIYIHTHNYTNVYRHTCATDKYQWHRNWYAKMGSTKSWRKADVKLTESWWKADGKLTPLVNLGGVLARKADAFGYPFQLTHFSSPILAYPFQGRWSNVSLESMHRRLLGGMSTRTGLRRSPFIQGQPLV